MKLNITLTQTQEMLGYVVTIIYTRATANFLPGNSDVNNLPPASAIVYTNFTPAPILNGVEVVLSTPTLPASPYYGVMFGQSISGTLSDFTPIQGSILSPALTSDAETRNAISQFPIYDPVTHVLIGYAFPPGKIIGFRATFP